MKAQTPLRGVLLDIDGTLLDSNDAHASAFERAFSEADLDVPAARIRPLVGMGTEKLLPALGVSPTSAVGEQVSHRKKELFGSLFLPRLRPFPAARDLLDHMKSRRLELVVATSAEGDELSGLLRQAGIADCVDDHSSSSDAGSSKPDPDIVEAAVRRSGHPPEALIMLGDTPYDVEAARRAGVRIVALRCGGWSDGDLEGAVEIYDDPADLLANYGRSVFATGA